jgi:hypothetical protein
MRIPRSAGLRRDLSKPTSVRRVRASNLPASKTGFALQWLVTIGTVEFEFGRFHICGHTFLPWAAHVLGDESTCNSRKGQSHRIHSGDSTRSNIGNNLEFGHGADYPLAGSATALPNAPARLTIKIGQ